MRSCSSSRSDRRPAELTQVARTEPHDRILSTRRAEEMQFCAKRPPEMTFDGCVVLAVLGPQPCCTQAQLRVARAPWARVPRALRAAQHLHQYPINQLHGTLRRNGCWGLRGCSVHIPSDATASTADTHHAAPARRAAQPQAHENFSPDPGSVFVLSKAAV